MPIKIGLIGAMGRMGQAIEKLALGPFSITAKFTRENPVRDGDFDLFLDVSLPNAFASNLKVALAAKKPYIIGVTGLSDEAIDSLKNAAKQIPIFYAPNFSLGMAVLLKLAEQTAKLYPHAEIDLVETHHIHKKDAPSGAAKLLASAIHPKIPSIHSLRIGQTIGKHELIFNSPEEQITLTHTAHTRDLFARGALTAAQFLSTQTPGFYTMDDYATSSCR